jgi:hypothetical protein
MKRAIESTSTDDDNTKKVKLENFDHHRSHSYQNVDEVRIATIPRYKTSDISGDEWRISAKIEFF